MINKDSNYNEILENSREYTVTEILYILKKNFKLIFFINLFFLFATIYYSFLVKPKYYAAAVIMVNEDQNSMSLLNMSLGSNGNYIDNELEILKSRTTSELVVTKLFNSKYKNDLYVFNTKRYKSSSLRNFLSFGVLDRMQNNHTLGDTLSMALMSEFASKIRKSITVSNIRNTDAINITVTSCDPHEATLLTNAIVNVYTQRDLEYVTGEMNHLKIFLTEQISQKEIELNNIENKLKEFQEVEKLYSLDDNYSLILNSLTDFEGEYSKILAQLNIFSERENYLNNQLTEQEKNLTRKVSSTINERLLALKKEMVLVEIELISTKTKYDNDHIAIKNLEFKLKKLRTDLEQETNHLIAQGLNVYNPIQYRQALIDSVIGIQAIKSNLENKSKEYEKIVNEYSQKLSMLPEKVLNFTRLERQRQVFVQTYSFMQSKLEEARIGEASKLGKIRIIDSSVINNISFKPNKGLNILIGGAFGLIFSIFIVFVIEYFDNTIKTIEQIERRGLSILAIIPAIGESEKRKKSNKKYLNIDKDIKKLQRRLITREDPKSPISESYRALRTSLMYSKNESQSNLILVSSSGPGEGKTTTIANLAITYANLGKKTLLIDSDLRKPVLHNVFKLDKTPGLTTFLSMNSNIDEIINSTEVNNLDVVTSGIIPPNPSELLSSEKMKFFIDFVKSKYDIVLFDTPPLIAVTDAHVILKYINQFILVVRSGVTERGALERVLASINHSDFSLNGIVMNAMSEKNAYGSGYYYNYYQYYYGKSE